MKIFKRKLDNTREIIPTIYRDNRGIFYESYHVDKYRNSLNISENFVQQNCSISSQGVLRGLHFQKKFPQGKLVRVTKGKIFDVIVDLRSSSKTFCQWDGIYLDDVERNQFWIPKGFAHGFISLSKDTEVEYMCTDIYHPDDEMCLTWNDEDLKIEWPLNNPIVSEKDQNGKTLKEIIKNKFVYD